MREKIDDPFAVIQQQGLGSSEIEVLGSLEALRLRPEWYIGPGYASSEGLTILLQQTFCMAIDGGLSGETSALSVTIDGDKATVQFDGPGIPIELVPNTQLREATLMFTLHCGCRAVREHPPAAEKYCAPGLAATSALSSSLRFSTPSGSQTWSQEIARGKVVTELVATGAISTLTEISFVPDREIFGEVRFDRDSVAALLARVNSDVPRIKTSLRFV
jgi:DNA gyrase/topoisomerase IV subunit B